MWDASTWSVKTSEISPIGKLSSVKTLLLVYWFWANKVDLVTEKKKVSRRAVREVSKWKWAWEWKKENDTSIEVDARILKLLRCRALFVTGTYFCLASSGSASPSTTEWNLVKISSSFVVNLSSSSSSPRSCSQYKLRWPDENVRANTRPEEHDLTGLNEKSPGIRTSSWRCALELDLGAHVKSKKPSSSAEGLMVIWPFCGNGVHLWECSSYRTCPALNEKLVISALWKL